MRGTVTTLRHDFGFIKADDGQDFFFHDSDLVDEFELNVGDVVTFEQVEPRPEKGPRAKHVTWEAPQ
jgi:cold shock CspA family protein